MRHANCANLESEVLRSRVRLRLPNCDLWSIWNVPSG